MDVAEEATVAVRVPAVAAVSAAAVFRIFVVRLSPELPDGVEQPPVLDDGHLPPPGPSHGASPFFLVPTFVPVLALAPGRRGPVEKIQHPAGAVRGGGRDRTRLQVPPVAAGTGRRGGTPTPPAYLAFHSRQRLRARLLGNQRDDQDTVADERLDLCLRQRTGTAATAPGIHGRRCTGEILGGPIVFVVKIFRPPPLRRHSDAPFVVT
mmetsp:Transcript_3780/g.5541  ORF Transcript_3780/g.5541 Transcript_3780/m.5541 type:complete len:208 (+) Transcript_3780:365-988(+)